MDKVFDKLPQETRRIAYVRAVKVADLPDDIRAQAGDASQLYAVHDEDGARLALVAGKRLAFMLAKENNLAPVQVH